MSENMRYDYFVLGYNAMSYFRDWFDFGQFRNTNLRIVDNGNQQIPEELQQYVIHQNEKNIGCSGGWNLICDIGFNHFGLDKIIVGQEDGRISEEVLEELLNRCDPNMICGTYNNSFEFSTYAIHRETFNKVGRFDENFMFVGCEDNDYKHRCKLKGIEVQSLGISHEFNCSIANNVHTVPSTVLTHNPTYILNKWNDYTYTEPFNGVDMPKYTDYFIEVHGNVDMWPSESEFLRFRNGVK